MTSLQDVEEFDSRNTYLTEEPCFFCQEGMMRLWKEDDGTIVFYCYGNLFCRNAFTYDLKTKRVIDVDAPFVEVWRESFDYVEKVHLVTISDEEVKAVAGDKDFLTRFDVWAVWKNKTKKVPPRKRKCSSL